MLWEKYRREDKRTICVIGVLILATKLCKADGSFTISEEEAILEAMPHQPREKKIILKILDEAGKDENSIEYHADIINKLLIEQKQFRKFIIAFLYHLAHSDHVYSEEEDKDIRKVASAFGIEKTYFEKIILYLKNLFNKRESNAQS